VLEALLWGFHNSRDGRCFPSYERIAAKAECHRCTVAEALRVLEWAGVLTWQHRIARVRERCRDLWGREGWHWRVVRTSNAYVFRDPGAVAPHPAGNRRFPSKSKIRPEHSTNYLNLPYCPPTALWSAPWQPSERRSQGKRCS
jgi:hypothetical protein